MTVTPIAFATRSAAHLHEPFLARASDGGNERGHALGAFLTLRVVDRIAEEPKIMESEALKYQLRACATYLDEVYPQTEEVTHLREIVRVAESSTTTVNKRRLWAPLLAYGFWLEQQLRLDESLDVLESTLRLENASAIDEKIAAHLQRGRVLRLAGRFPESHTAYAIAGELANLRGDHRSGMVSRIGRATNLQKTGDLPGSETILRDVLVVAQGIQDSFVQSRALHQLAMTMHLMKRLPDAVSLAFRAFELYDEPVQRARALSDVGMFLKDLGHYTAAKDAFTVVLNTGPSPEIRVNTVLELLELAAQVQDRVGFERWRRELETQYEHLPTDERVDFEMKLGVGLAAFGNDRDGVTHLERAVALAEEFKLGQRVFEADQLLRELRAGKTRGPDLPARQDAAIEPEVQSAIDSLFALKRA